jgi:hypothetical protein
MYLYCLGRGEGVVWVKVIVVVKVVVLVVEVHFIVGQLHEKILCA